MLYRLLHFIVSNSLMRHYNEIKSFNHAAIPDKGSLLIAATHPNSFLDALVIASSIKRPLHFLARSDVFRQKWAAFMLRKMNLIPIYRIAEGRENLHKNEDTFQACYDILNDEGAILIFAEGVSIADKKVRPLKKGLARILFGFLKEYPNQDIPKLICAGINYMNPVQFNTNILLGYSDPLELKELIGNPKSDNAIKFKKLNEKIYHSLIEHSIVVEPEDEHFHLALIEFDSCFNQNSLIRKSLIAEKIASLKRKNPNDFQALKNETLSLRELLSQRHLSISNLKQKDSINLLNWVLFIVTIPFGLLGFLLNFLPFYLARVIAKPLTQKEPIFYPSVRFALGTLIWIVTAVSISIAVVFGYHWLGVFSPLLMILLFKYYQISTKLWKRIKSNLRLRKLKLNKDLNTKVQEKVRTIVALKSSIGLMTKS